MTASTRTIGNGIGFVSDGWQDDGNGANITLDVGGSLRASLG